MPLWSAHAETAPDGPAVTPSPERVQSSRPSRETLSASEGATAMPRARGSLSLPATSVAVTASVSPTDPAILIAKVPSAKLGLSLVALRDGFTTRTRLPASTASSPPSTRVESRVASAWTFVGSGAAGGVRSTSTTRVPSAVSGATPTAVANRVSGPSGTDDTSRTAS